MNHLTDDQLQTWLEKADTISLKHIQDHLVHCHSCREHLLLYERLYKALEQHEPLSIPDDFADQVMNHLPEKSVFKKIPFWVKTGGIIVGLSGLFFPIYFMNKMPVLGFWEKWKTIVFNIWEPLRVSMQRVLNIFDGAAFWFLAGVSVLIMIMILDKCLRIKWSHQLLYH